MVCVYVCIDGGFAQSISISVLCCGINASSLPHNRNYRMAIANEVGGKHVTFDSFTVLLEFTAMT